MTPKSQLRERTIAAEAWDALSADDRRLTLHVFFVRGERLFEDVPEGGLQGAKAAIAPCATRPFAALPPLVQEALLGRVQGQSLKLPFEKIQEQKCSAKEGYWQHLYHPRRH